MSLYKGYKHVHRLPQQTKTLENAKMLSLISILYISAVSGSALASPVTWNHGHRNTVNKTWDCAEVSIFST